MAINYVYEKEDEELVEYIKDKIPKELKNLSASICITDVLEDLQSIKISKNVKRHLIVITQNYSREFVTCALERTSCMVYKTSNYDLIVKKVIKLLKKR